VSRLRRRPSAGGERRWHVLFSGHAHVAGRPVFTLLLPCLHRRSNRDFQLGVSNVGQSNVPLPVDGGLLFESISADDTHTCGVLLNASGVCFGCATKLLWMFLCYLADTCMLLWPCVCGQQPKLPTSDPTKAGEWVQGAPQPSMPRPPWWLAATCFPPFLPGGPAMASYGRLVRLRWRHPAASPAAL